MFYCRHKTFQCPVQAEVKKDLAAEVSHMLKEEATQDALIERVRAVQEEHRIPESEIVKLVRLSTVLRARRQLWRGYACVPWAQPCGGVCVSA